MVELRGVRYAVGTATARWTVLAVSLGLMSYCGYAAAVVLALALPAGWAWPRPAAAVVFGSSTLIYAAFLTVGGLIVLALSGADRQPVMAATRPDGRWRDHWRSCWSSDPRRFLSSGVGLGVVSFLSLEAVQAMPAFGSGWLVVAWLSVTGMVVGGHAFALIRTSRRIWSDAHQLVNGRIDLYRDFDWDAMDLTDDDKRFRERFRNRRWPRPPLIEHPRHAERLAAQARGWRWGWLAVSATIGALFVMFAMTPLRRLGNLLVEPSAHALGASPFDAVTLKQHGLFLVCIVLLWTPVLAQHCFATDLDALAKLYDDRAVELREQRRRGAVHMAIPWVASLPPHAVERFTRELLDAAPPTEGVVAVVQRWQHVHERRSRRATRLRQVLGVLVPSRRAPRRR